MSTVSDAFFSLVGENQDDDWIEFHRQATAGRLVVQSCGQCGKRRWPAATACRACHSCESAWVEVAPSGVVWSFIVAHPPVVTYLADRVPLTIALVALDDDRSIRIYGEVAAGHQVEIGDRVTASFRVVADEVSVPVWSTSQGGAAA